MAQPQHMEAASNFLVPNATFFVEVAVFLVILWILGKYVLPPLQKAMNDRQAVISKQLEDAEAARVKLAESQAEYQRALTEARTQAAQIRDNATKEAQRTVDEMHAKAREESDRIIARGEEQLINQRQSVIRDLRAEVGSLAIDLASKIVGESLADEARQQGTVERFLADLDASDRSGSGATDTGAAKVAG